MQSVTVLDTSIASDNTGDQIIMDAVYDVLDETIPHVYLFRVLTHDFLGEVSRNIVRHSRLAIVGGTNILDSHVFSRNALWKLRLIDAYDLRSVLLLGVGWRGYAGPASRITCAVLRRVLSPALQHSVRDSYTAGKLQAVIPNVCNTACVTMWTLTPEWCAGLPRKRAAAVVTTLTFYNPDRTADTALLKLLVAKYRRVFFWPQQYEDQAYVGSLGVSGVTNLRPNLRSYNAFLDNEEVDFIGTRLHGGIRAMQKGHRALIIGIDNRATEIHRDTNLPVVQRQDLAAVEAWIDGEGATEISLPAPAIQAWKAQLADHFS
jgi:polysaccharide pyruvyl transferase WcaK-like protein